MSNTKKAYFVLSLWQFFIIGVFLGGVFGGGVVMPLALSSGGILIALILFLRYLDYKPQKNKREFGYKEVLKELSDSNYEVFKKAKENGEITNREYVMSVFALELVKEKRGGVCDDG